MDDFLTKPWFILLLGSVLAIMMLSFGAMVFVKRKHMLMKQGALNTMSGKRKSISSRIFFLHTILSRIYLCLMLIRMNCNIYTSR